jgi:antitoxin (DNA-binding transcriptional repressor) of toxin-antitoxin stability system
MKALSVGDLKTNFSAVLTEVKNGGTVEVLYGRAKNPVAMFVPYKPEQKGKRKIGILDGRANIKFKKNFKMTVEELLGLQ